MRDWRAFVLNRLRLTAVRPGREARLIDEVAGQLEDLCRDALSAGASEEEADRRARQHVTDWDRLAADLAAANRVFRESPTDDPALPDTTSGFRPGVAIGLVCQDLRLAARGLRRRPGTAAILVLTLGLGLGAISAIFGAVDAVLFRPLPYGEPDRLVALFSQNPGEGHFRWEVSMPNVADWRASARSFEGMAAYFRQSLNLSGAAEPRRVGAARVSLDTLRVLKVAPLVGADFAPTDDQSTRGEVALISHRIWQQVFAGDRGAIGRALRLDGVTHTIIGVMPSSFEFPSPDVDVWRPMPRDPARLGGRGRLFASAVGRLAPGVTLEEAGREMDLIAARLALAYPKTNRGWGVGLESLGESQVGSSRSVLLIAWLAAALVLLMACVNVAGLLVTNAGARGGEMAVRAALGASRRRIVAQVLAEVAVVAAVAGALGIGLAAVGVRVLATLAASLLPRVEHIGLDHRVIGFTAAMVVVVALLSGILPALRASAGSRIVLLRESGRTLRSGRRRSVRHVLAAVELALAVTLLASTGLIVRSLANLWSVPTGIDPRTVLTFEYDRPTTRETTREQIDAFNTSVADALEALPGIRSVALATLLPLQGDIDVYDLSIPGRPVGSDVPLSIQVRQVSPGFLATLGIPVVQGRGFLPSDRPTSDRVAIISRAAATRYWPHTNPVGSRIVLPMDQSGTPWTIVGLAEDVPTNGLDVAASPVVYVPLAQSPLTNPQLVVAVRTTLDTASTLRAVRARMAGLDPDLPLFNVQTIEDLRRDAISRQRFGSWVLAIFAVVALLLSLVGVYATVSHLVAERRHEIGVRMAVGAGPREILRMVLGEGAALAAVGLAAGAIGAAAMARLLESLLFGVASTDPATHVATAAIVLVVVGLASWLPAIRATRTDPVTTLRA